MLFPFLYNSFVTCFSLFFMYNIWQILIAWIVLDVRTYVCLKAIYYYTQIKGYAIHKSGEGTGEYLEPPPLVFTLKTLITCPTLTLLSFFFTLG